MSDRATPDDESERAGPTETISMPLSRSRAAAAATVLALLAASAPVRAADDGLALLPPMGWRMYHQTKPHAAPSRQILTSSDTRKLYFSGSWNAFGNAISHEVICAQADGLTDRSRAVNGAPASLRDVGYTNLGIDEGHVQNPPLGPHPPTYHPPPTPAHAR